MSANTKDSVSNWQTAEDDIDRTVAAFRDLS